MHVLVARSMVMSDDNHNDYSSKNRVEYEAKTKLLAVQDNDLKTFYAKKIT